MIPTKPVRDEVRPNRATLLIGSATALLCLGAGVASAQTAVPDAPDAPAAQDEQLAPTDTAVEPSAEDSGQAAEPTSDAGNAAAGSDDEGTKRSARDGTPRLLVENVTPHQIYFGGKRPAEFHYKHTGAGSADLRVEAVKKTSGKVIKSWRKNNVPADRKQQLRWDGSRTGGGHVRKGRFFFRVETTNDQSLNRKRASGKRELLIQPAIFPVRGRHQYWDGFGAGRGHEGQDVGANCGTKLAAAEPGKVAYKAYDGGGYGYYAVINVRSQNRAEVYAHMKRPAAVRQGQRVKTGQKIGVVGSTGSSTACHLHFEYWKGDWPGGRAVPRVTKRLRAWDKWS